MVKTIDELITETTDALNLKIKDKEKATKDAEMLDSQLKQFKELKKEMDSDPEYAAHFDFK